MSIDRLIGKIKERDNPTVVGLDPVPENIPPEIMEAELKDKGECFEALGAAYLKFNCGLIDALYDIVPAIKPQSAYYEMLGPVGAVVYYETIKYAQSRGMYVIADAKRNDIGSTAEAYAEAYLGAVKIGGKELEPYGADALTINGYLGTDGILPFLKRCGEREKAVFVLVKTSNPSSAELQDRITEGERVYVRMAEMVSNAAKGSEGQYGYIQAGAVVGATYPRELSELRSRYKNVFFLVPGYGAQGGRAADIAGAFNSDGIGAIINSSRGIIYAWRKNGGDYRTAARKEAETMRAAIRAGLQG